VGVLTPAASPAWRMKVRLFMTINECQL
jgi:hypothetical protein